ncbi:MAG TPA: beta-propeller fold lactonase family protein, partial [Steroidobacteraceae bacterium]|nr:beta-propeller fold lactonase family protein [Steroidobacteraceae bacterium]
AMHPSGRYLYYITATYLGVRRVDTQNGALNAAFAEVTGGINTAIAIHPTGHFAYVTRMGNPGQVNVYRIRSSGPQVGQFVASTPISSGGNDAVSIALHPTGRFLYVANRASNDVAAFAVNPTTGELTGIGMPVSFNSPTVSVRVDYSGNFLYVVDSTPQVRTFAINTTTGALAAVTPGLSIENSPRELVLTEDIE